MLFKILPHELMQDLIDMLLNSLEVIGPNQVGRDVRGRPIHQFLQVEDATELDLDYQTTQYSAKTYFLPYQEILSSYEFSDSDWSQDIQYREIPRVLFGLHACDINALLKLDKVLARPPFPSPYYVARRANTLIIGLDHQPCEGGFCNSFGTDAVTHGFDLFFSDLGDRYFVSINSDRGFSLMTKLAVREVTEADRQDYLAYRRNISAEFKHRLDVQNLPNLLDLEFESPVWPKWGAKCFSCGGCAMVCPTCYCYGVNERVSMDFKRGWKKRQLYSCNVLDFAQVAGGHNFRPDAAQRLKYRYYHQYRGFVESFDEPKCVGCNRCGRVCLSHINPKEIILELQGEHAS